MTPSEYDFSAIERKWQDFWALHKTFRTPDFAPGKPKYYVLDMFPYPSGAGLHVGHPEGYTATDILCRYKRMRGFNVLHPMGWDAFGLPAEQYAIQTGTHPAETTRHNCDVFRRQIQSLGMSYDWDREVNTTDPAYYRWTQWIFTQLYDTWFDAASGRGRPIRALPIPPEVAAQGPAAERAYRDARRLAYYADAQVWWCRQCRIVCANEEVLNDGSHEKCGSREVERRFLKQWLLRLPLYAERLLAGLDALDWPAGIKEMQRNWIGRSAGAEVDFPVVGQDAALRVYTTRPDTLFGATYVVIAPEHGLLSALTVPARRAAVEAYVRAASLKSDLDRTDLAKRKTGVFTGAHVRNPANGQPIPVWVADYVLTGYGTGAIMAVPAHDTRDFEFARQFDLPVRAIMEPNTDDADLRRRVIAGEACWTEDGTYMRASDAASGLDINGLCRQTGIARTIAWLEARGFGKATVHYKLRDWLFSRQRYWGEPFPIVHWEDGEVALVPEEDLPVRLPDLDRYLPGEGGESPLANAVDWVAVVDPATGRRGRRETNTMPQWAGSCWYYLRYLDPRNHARAWSPEAERYWMPVDLYVGGAEHAVLHLLYSRFWHKVLYDLGHVSTDEPFQRLFNQGMILAYAYADKVGSKVASDLVEARDGRFFHRTTGEELTQLVAKMSKTLKNVVNPDDIVRTYGADSLRLYEMFMGPLDATKPWSTQGVEGVFRFLRRAFRMLVDQPVVDVAPTPEQRRILHATVKKVTEDIEALGFNTAISQLMICLNAFAGEGRTLPREVAETYTLLLAPFAPHLGEELWARLGHTDTLAYAAWPTWDESALKVDEVEIVVQVLGKPRARCLAPVDADEAALRALALALPAVQSAIAHKTVRKVVCVPGRLVNIVVD